MLEDIKDQWQPGENGCVTCHKVVDCLSLNKTELYNRAMNYFVSNYGDVDSVIQERDTVNGIIAAKGVFKNVHTLNDVLQTNIVDTWHILKVEVKDGKARITISLTQYNETVKGSMLPDVHYLYPITEQYPYNPNAYQKQLYAQAFCNSHLKALETINLVERALTEGVATKKDEW